MNKNALIPRRKVLGLGVALAGLCAGCAVLPDAGSAESAAGSQAASGNKAVDKVEKAPLEDINSVHLRDNPELYTVYDDSGVVTMYLTVSRGNDSENTNHSWAQINHYSVYDYAAMGVPRYQVNALLQVGDENGPLPGELGYGVEAPNATVQIRGQTSSRNAQKNYKIELKKNKGSWRCQRSIALNKHMGEGLRFRNKMAYDLIKGIDQMMGLRTQFVHLYVKDLTDSDTGAFVDYGLYTQVEQLNKTALKAHGLDSTGQLYKINSFEFHRNEDIIRLTTDPAYDQTAFEQLMEIKGNSDHSKLIEMLDVLNDESSSMEEEVFARYFDPENIAYWLAFQLLTGNTDTQSRNVYLYSPQNSDCWYLLDWDNDGMLRRKEREIIQFSDSESWERGVSNYWGNVLFRRCLQTESFRQLLDTAMDELYAYMNQDRIESMLAHYRSVTEEYVWRMPDRLYVPITHEQYEEVLESIWPEIDEDYDYYWESYNTPWKGLRFSYDRTFVNIDIDDAPSQDMNGFSLGYVQSFSIAKKLPLFFETGAGINFARYSDSESDSETIYGYTISAENKWSTTTLGLTIPLNVVYKININDKLALKPYTGFYLRVNLMSKSNDKMEVSIPSEFSQYVDASDYEWDEDYNNFDKDDVGEDGTWNRVQFGWQIGATLDINKFNVGIGYALDFNEIAEKTKCGIFSARLGFNF